jgi:preprotein translocase subunit Sec63
MEKLSDLVKKGKIREIQIFIIVSWLVFTFLGMTIGVALMRAGILT